MKLKWLGHSCFLLTSQSGTRILTDPFDERVGYTLPAVSADIVTTSHGHSDHNTVSVIKGSFRHIGQPGEFAEGDIRIKGIPAFHDEVQGKKRGPDIIYVFEVDGYRICHCGDLGHLLSDAQVKEIGRVDVLLLPVGGNYTIDSKAACEVMKQLKAAITIPMHYKTEVMGFPIDGVDAFLQASGMGERYGKQEIEINEESLKKHASVVVLNYFSN